MPKNLISTGIVITPIISVNMQAPICIYPASFFKNIVDVGKAIIIPTEVRIPRIWGNIFSNRFKSNYLNIQQRLIIS